MFLDSFKKLCDLVSGVMTIIKDKDIKNLSRWFGLVMPFVTGFSAFFDGLKQFPVAVQDKAIVTECAKYFDSKFVLPGKLEDVDDELAEISLRIAGVIVKLTTKTA